MAKWPDAFVYMRAKKVDIFGLVEINVNPKHPVLTKEVLQIRKCNWTHATTMLVNTDMDCGVWGATRWNKHDHY